MKRIIPALAVMATVVTLPLRASDLSFTDITRAAGVGGPTAAGKTGGHGAMFADVDGDGLPDLYFTMIFEAPMADLFFHNRGQGVFADAGRRRGLADDDGGSHGACFADLDGDGDYDLFNGTTWDHPESPAVNNVYRNDGRGFFTDVTASSGIPLDRRWPTRGVLTLDMDGDGDLDLFCVTNYRGSRDPAGERNEVYRNDGNLHFHSIDSGALWAAPCGQGATDADFDGDGDVDVLAANRTGDVNILRNDGRGNFSPVAPAAIGVHHAAGDGITLGDVDNDGDLDMLLASDNEGHLYLNSGDGRFRHVQSFAATDGYMGGFGDLDLDGDLDLVFAGDDRVYLNDGRGRYLDGPAVPVSGINDPRGIAFADIDDDGDLDFAIGAKRSHNWLIRNDHPVGRGWLKVRLVSPRGQAGAFGAKVRVYPAGRAGSAEDAGTRLVGFREARSQNGYLGQNDPVLHFGLGARASVDVVVDFLDGTRVVRTRVESAQTLTISGKSEGRSPPAGDAGGPGQQKEAISEPAATPEPLVRLDLTHDVTIFASHATTGDEFKAANAIDGDPATKWVGEGHPLTFQPSNLVLEFSHPVVVARLALTSIVFRDRLALKDVEVYGWARTTWDGGSPLAVSKGTRDVRTVLDLIPARTQRLRIRVLDTWRDDHAFPRIHEIEAYEARGGDALKELEDAAIPGESKSERLLLRRALGEEIVFPGETFDPEKGFLYYARGCLDTLITEGTDRYGSVHSPMFASLLDMETHRNPEDAPANIPGQRFGDRAIRGGNLFHDVMLLRACDLVSRITSDETYRRAATDYLRFFLEHCPQPTGLWPWGEHAHWDFYREGPGHETHEYLGGVPSEFWERVWALNPGAVRGEADGLINHVVNLETFDFDRHARLGRPLAVPRPRGLGFLDFPRHAGFYLGLWSFVHAKTGEARYLEWSRKLIDHHWRARDPRSGLPPSSTRTQRADSISVESALSLAVSLLEAGERVADDDARKLYREVAVSYLNPILALPHRPEAGQFMTSFPRGEAPETARGGYSEPFRYAYGGGFTADDAVLLLAAYRKTNDARALELADAFGEFYRDHAPPPPSEIVRAHVYASILGLELELYTLRGSPDRLEAAERTARLAIERLFHRGLFRGATGVDHYEGDMMVGNLVYNLVWLHAVKAGVQIEVPPNHFNR